MKKLSFFTALLLQILLLTFGSLFSQTDKDLQKKNENYYPPFTIIYPQPYYLPGDTVIIRLNATWTENRALFTVKVYLVKDPEKFYLSQASRGLISVVAKDSSSLSGLLEEVTTFNQELGVRKKKHKNETSIYNVDDNIKYIPTGYGTYVIRIYHKSLVASCGFFVSSFGFHTRVSQNSILNYTANRISGEPVDDVKLLLFLNGTKYAEGITAGGTLHSIIEPEHKKIIDKYNEITPFFMAIKNEEVAVSDPYFYFYSSKETYKAQIITNQPVYRPPAAVNFKASIREFTVDGYTVYAHKSVIVAVSDASNTKIYRKLLKTDENGSINDSLKIDEGAPLGNYLITLIIIGDKDKDEEKNNTLQIIQQYFSVEEYKKPEYKTEIKTDKEQYTDNEKITLEIQSDYYFGSPVQDAEVEYNIYKKPLYRPWWYFSEYRWWYQDYYSSINKKGNYSKSSYIDKGEGRLDKNGHLQITYSIKEDFKEKRKNSYYKEDKYYETDYMYIFNVYVKDKSRTKVLQTKTVNVTRSDYNISSNTDKYIYKPGEKVGVEIRAVDFSDKKIETSVNISVNRIVYEGKYPKMKKRTSFVCNYSGKTSALGNETVFFDAAEEGYYDIEVVSYDSRGKKVSDKTSCFVSKGNMWWWDRDPATVEIIPEKETYNPGDTVTALVMTAHENVPILVTNHNGNILSYWVERTEGNSAYIKVPVYEHSSPNFYISVTYISNGQFYSNSCSIAVIPAHKFADIQLSSDKPVYRPREEGVINVSIKDKQGNPLKNADVTLGMIDESIYAIKPENVPDIKTVFYSPVKNNTQVSFSYNNLAYYSISAGFPVIFEKTDYKQIPPEKLCSVNGKLVDYKGDPVRWAHIIIDKQYEAAATNSEGKFEFKLPAGKYRIYVFYGNTIYEGNVILKAETGNDYEMEIKVYNGNIVSALLNGVYVNPLETYIEENQGTGTSRIKGNVRDDKDNSPLIGAIISIEGTTFKTGSDDKGDYVILNVPFGTFNVKCTYVGYTPQIVQGVTITKENSVVTVDFALGVGGLMMDTIMIATEREGIIKSESSMILRTETWYDYGIRGIENIAAKTNGIVLDEKEQQINIRGGRTGENQIIIDSAVTENPIEQYVEAEVRSDFRDAILWMPAVKTDENGNAQVKVNFPDNLTTWRMTARVITTQTEVGQTTQSLISRKDLIIRVETPRFFQQNDIVTVSTILHNYLDEDKQTKVNFKLDNAVLINPVSNEQVITLLKNEEKRIDWVIKIDKPIGTAKVFASALTNQESDAMEQKLPIHPFGLKIENSSAYQVASGSVTKTFSIPVTSDIRSSGLNLAISPSLASSLIASLDGLIGYPYGCVEQTMSRFMPTVITASVLKEIGAPDDPYFKEQIPRMVSKGFNKLQSMQHSDHGWGWWKNDNSNPFMTAYVVYGLTLAKQNGYDPKNIKVKKAAGYLKKTLNDEEMDLATRAYIVWVISIADSSNFGVVKEQLIKLEKKELNDISMAFLSMAAGNTGDKETQQDYLNKIMRNTNKDENGSFWGGKIFKYYWQEDNIQATAMVLKALMANDESRKNNKDVINDGVNWMISKRKGTTWGNTMQTAFAVYSLSDYIRLNHETETDYTLKVFVNERNILDKQVTKDDIFKPEILIKIAGTVVQSGENIVRIEKFGTGKAYITQQVIYYESENKKEVENTDNGFDIERDYYALERIYDKSNEEYYYSKHSFEGTIRSGYEMFVKVKVTPGIDNADYFMLEEPIPAGCEVIKEDWAYPIRNETYFKGDNNDSWRWWYSDKDIRDNRIVFFATHLKNRETYEFTYLLRAQIPGTFNVMPSRGVLMYYPEINGSSGNMVVKIVD